MARTRADEGRVRASNVALGALLAGVLWQPVLLGHKPGWMYFGAGKIASFALLPLPLVVAFILARYAGKRGWLQGGLILAIGYLLTIPYNIWVEMQLPTGFISYGGTLWSTVGGIVTFAAVFFGLGAGVGLLAGRTASRRRAVDDEVERVQASQGRAQVPVARQEAPSSSNE